MKISSFWVRDDQGKGWMCQHRSGMRELYGNESVLYLDCGGGYVKLHMIKLYRTILPAKNACKIRISSANCTNVNFLVVILYYNYWGASDGGDWMKGARDFSIHCLLLVTSSESLIIST
jgi:hypothetical protein